jgi:hypothetical protein
MNQKLSNDKRPYMTHRHRRRRCPYLQVTGWAAQMGWRPFPVDVAGFAFNASMLRNTTLPLWPFECKIGHKVQQES